jgi:zinc transport system substrate-binding protein
MMRHLLSLLALVAAGLLLAACGSTSSSGDAGARRVVAAFYPLAFAAEQVGASSVDVENLTPAGAEPHDLELTPGDVRDVQDAALVLYLGDDFMPALEQALRDRDGRSVDLLAVARRGAPDRLANDPHVWLDPVRYAAIVRSVGAALGEPAPARRLQARLLRLDRDYRQGLAHCERRELVTSHAAFGWLAARYGLQQVPLEGLTPEAEPSAKQIERLVETVRRTGASTVFAETLLSPKLAETVAREAGVKTAVLDPLEGIGKDELAMGADYFTIMRANLAALREALGCR